MFKKLFMILTVMALATTLVACGPKEEVVEEVAAQGITDTEVLIANCAATSGAFAPVGVPFIAGIEAYLKTINDAGGIDGRTIKF